MKHTPGPWEVVRSWRGELEPFDAKNDHHLLSSESPLPLEEREANAHLIAAAPELLEALEALMAAYESYARDQEYEGNRWQPEYDENYQQAKKAVAKAKGE